MIFLKLAILLSFWCIVSSNFPDQSLEHIRDIILKSKPQIIDVILKLENKKLTAFSMKFLNLLTNSKNLYPITVQTISSASKLQYNDTRVNMGYEKVVVHILNDDSEQSIKDCGSVLHKKLKRKQLNRFILIIEKINSKNTIWLKNFFKEFEQKKILDVMIFYYDDDLKIFRYNPFLPKPQQLLKINKTTETNQYVISDLNGHRIKVVFNLAGYTIIKDIDKANRTTYRGTNIQMASLLGERMNASITYQENDEPNATNVLDFIARELNADYDVFAVNLFSFNKKVFDDLGEECGKFFIMLFHAMVPEAGTLPSYQNIYFALDSESWIFVAASILFVTLLQKFFQFIYRKANKMHVAENQKEIPLWQNFLITIQVFVGDSLTKIPQFPTGSLILLGWILYSYLVTSAFTAKLLSSLISPRQADNIDTLDQLFESNVQINLLTELKPHFKTYVKQDTREKIFNHSSSFKFVSFSNITDEVKANYLGRNNSYIMADYVINRFIVQYYDKVHQKPYFHKMAESFMFFPGVYFLQRGSPHLERVNHLLGMFHEFGFFVCWEELAIFRDTLNGAYETEQPEEESEGKVTLTKDHLQAAFYVWFIGMFCAVASLIGELILSFYRQKRSKTPYPIRKIIVITKTEN